LYCSKEDTRVFGVGLAPLFRFLLGLAGRHEYEEKGRRRRRDRDLLQKSKHRSQRWKLSLHLGM
jgi:hypothetical protein